MVVCAQAKPAPETFSGLRTASRWTVPIAAALTCVACASFQDRPPDPAIAKRLAEVQAVAGPPVNSFRYMRMSAFEPIGLRNLLVFTSPRSAWLLRLDAPCRGLDFYPFMGLTSHMHLVSTDTDSVRVQNNPIPCRIVQIQPVDAGRLRHVDAERPVPDQAQPDEAPSAGAQP